MDHINIAQISVSPSGKCLIAMSGGRDSMALAHYLSVHGISCIWAHCNFGLRGTESDEDEQFLRLQSELMHAEILVKRFTRDDLDRTSSNIQEAARILRYSWFSELCQRHEIPAICTAHHQDDQAETVLLQIIRGAGLKGLSGMKPNDHGVHRPLLQVSRGEIDHYIEEHHIPYREDSSNAKNNYSRNRIRNEIMPLLNHINPKTSEHLARTASLLSEYELFIRDSWPHLTKGQITHEEDRISIKAHWLGECAYPHAILWETLEPLGFTSPQTDEVLSLIEKQTGRRVESPTHLAYAERDSITIVPRETEKPTLVFFNTLNEFLDQGMLAVSTPRPIPNPKNTKPDEALIDAQALYFPLELRAWMEGEHFQPLGMHGTQKVSDFLTQQKVDSSTRKSQLILADQHGIVWIVGHRIAHRVRITDNTKNALMIRKKN